MWRWASLGTKSKVKQKHKGKKIPWDPDNNVYINNKQILLWLQENDINNDSHEEALNLWLGINALNVNKRAFISLSNF